MGKKLCPTMYQNKLQIHTDNKHLFCATRCQTLLGTEDSTMKRQSSSTINDTAQVKVHWGSPNLLWWEIFCYANLKEHLWNGEDAVRCPSHCISPMLSHPDAQWWHTGGAQIFSVLTQRNCFSLCVSHRKACNLVLPPPVRESVLQFVICRLRGTESNG